MDIFNSISQGVGAYLGAKEAAQAAEPTETQKRTGIILICIGLAVAIVLVIVLVKKS